MKVFEPFRLDTVNHCLWFAGERAPLTPKAFDVLRYLVENADRLVTQNELLEALWSETYVNPEGIRKYILEIRKVLGDRPERPQFIKTVPKRGYQFVAAVTEERSALSADTDAGKVVGREAALAQLLDHLEKALSGQRQLVFVTGEAGIGKTTLVDVFQKYASRRANLRMARGQCIEGFGGKEPYYPMLEAVGSLAQNIEGASWVQMLTQRAPTWLIQFPSLVKAEQRALLEREILGTTRDRMVREICEALEAMTAQTPLIVTLEDLHWVDPATLDLISAIARRREPAKLLLLGTYRPVDVVLSQSPLKALKQDLLVRQLCHEIAVEHLEEGDVAEYLAKTFAAESLPAGLSDLIHRNSGGNPLFMTAIVRDIAKKGLVAVDSEVLTLTAPLDEVYPGIPETLQQMLEIQIQQLSLEQRRILQSASVVGERFSVWSVAAMLDASPAAIEEECDILTDRFIRSAGIHDAQHGLPSAHYEFMHSLYRQALYRSLSGTHRAKLHLNLGERLMPICSAGRPDMASELALHFEEGRDYERAIHCWILAAENAASRFSRRDSIQILRHALDIVAPPAQSSRLELEVQILQRIGDAHFALGEVSESAASYEAAADRAAKAGLKAAQVEALGRLAVSAWYLDPDRGNRISQQALEVSKGLADPLLVARTQLAATSLRLLYDSWRKEDEEVCVRAQDTIRRLGASSVQSDVFYIVVQAVQASYPAALEQAEALIATTTNPIMYVLGVTAKSLTLLPWGRFGEVLRLVRTATELAEKNGEDPWIHIYCEAWLRLLCTDFDGVRRLSRLIMRSNAEQHAVRARTIALVASGYAELFAGRLEQALQCFADVRDFRVTPKFFLHWHWRMHADLGSAEAWLSSGNVANACREAESFLQSASSVADPNMRVLAWEVRSRVALAEKNLDYARQCIDNALAIVDQFDIPVVAWRVHTTASDLYVYQEHRERAAAHRTRARELVMRITDTFDEGEPLRESFLSSPLVRRIFEDVAST
jgi:DNA-binding winged helix-turn-helix (wHTH) protein/tetratricopeptide (TPR) repeat protein